MVFNIKQNDVNKFKPIVANTFTAFPHMLIKRHVKTCACNESPLLGIRINFTYIRYSDHHAYCVAQMLLQKSV